TAHALRAIELGADTGGRCVQAPARHALGLMLLGRGEHAAALEHLEPAADAVAEVREPGFMCHEPDLIEALAAAGRAGDARCAAERLDAAARGAPSDWSSAVAARGVALTAPAEAADEAFRRALDRCARPVPEFERARTQLAYG